MLDLLRANSCKSFCDLKWGFLFSKSGPFCSFIQENADTIDRDDEQNFLASADFLSNYGLPALVSDMQAAATEILKG